MKSLCLLAISIVIAQAVWVDPTYAVYNPQSVPNNRYGIHISGPQDIEAARDLVNSQGGDWGYITIVIREDNLDTKEWQAFFDKLRENHLIPIVRIATKLEGNYWAKPSAASVAVWVKFLESLNWVIKNRYVILFNEPNHAKEWGMDINPEEYSRIARLFQQELKKVSDEYFILPAGMDNAAGDTDDTMSSTRFFVRMHQEDPQVFNLFDGWTSHSYPNPAFSASPSNTGTGSIRGFEWELDYVSRLGFDKHKPVFITETGWQHNQGSSPNAHLDPNTLSEYYKTAFTKVWQSDQIIAVTPFILNYPKPPFDNFSFMKIDESGFHPFYDSIKSLPKSTGKPMQNHQSVFIKHGLPPQIITNTSYTYSIQFINTGQSIWDAKSTSLNLDTNIANVVIDPIPTTKPGELAVIYVHFSAYDTGKYYLSYSLANPEAFGQSVTQEITIDEATNLVVKLKMWLHKFKAPNDFTYAFLKFIENQAIGQDVNRPS